MICFKYTLTYTFTTSKESIGDYLCIAESEMGISKDMISLSLSTSEISILNENSQVYSDAYVFEWSCISGSPLHQLWIEVSIFKLFKELRIYIFFCYLGLFK
jgi:hypothetical protein